MIWPNPQPDATDEKPRLCDICGKPIPPETEQRIGVCSGLCHAIQEGD